MVNNIYMGIDNGITGSIGILYENELAQYFPVPVKKELSYTKTKQFISRIEFFQLHNLIEKTLIKGSMKAFIERPMINSGRFKSTVSALRALESVLIALETYNIPVQYVDSKQWQKQMLPARLKKDELKKASLDIGCRLFPHLKESIIKQKDADGILIAEWARRNKL